LANRIPVCATAHKAEDRGPQHLGHCTRMQDSRYESRCVFIMAQLYGVSSDLCVGEATRAWQLVAAHGSQGEDLKGLSENSNTS